MTPRLKRIEEQIEAGTYDDTDPVKMDAVVDGLLAEPMTFEEWWTSNKDIQEGRLSFDTLQWATLRSIAKLAYIGGETRQILAAMERRKR